MPRSWGTLSFFAAVSLLISILLVALRYSTQQDQASGGIPSINHNEEANLEEHQGVLAINYKQYKPSRPHIVFILADDLGYNDIGYHAIHGMSAVRTPHLDTLAADGVKLENYYVQPICSPSRSVLMTGRYLVRYGLQHRVFLAAQPTCLPLSETILPQKLKEQGYATHAIGKWHLGMCRTECLPTRRGFDSFFGYVCGGMDHYSHTRTYVYKVKSDHSTAAANSTSKTSANAIIDMGDNEPEDDVRGEYDDPDVIERDLWTGKDLWQNETVEWGYEGVYSTQLFTDKAKDVINKHDPKKPMFLYLAYKNVHRPLQAPDKYMEMFKHVEDTDRRTLAAMAYALDEGVKNVTDSLKINGMWDNTILVFSSDNGGMLKRGAGGNNWPLRGGKWTLWEGGIRAVGFVNSPLIEDQMRGTVNRQLMHISDWFPTFVHGVAGGNVTDMRKPLDGFNQWSMISKGEATHRKDILHNIDPLESYPKMSEEEKVYWTTHISANYSLNPLIHSAFRWGDWKLITGALISYAMWLPPPESGHLKQSLRNVSSPCAAPRGSVVRLYNIKNDPQETCNLARNRDSLQIVKYLLNRLREYADQSVPVYYPKEDRMANPELRGGAWKPWLDDDVEAYAKIYPFRNQPYM